MKIIKKLTEMIEDEIEGAKCYAKKALEWKDKDEKLAAVLYKLSEEEMRHLAILHEQVTRIISEYREEHGDPPPSMQAVYDYLHEKQIQEAERVKNYQALYKETA